VLITTTEAAHRLGVSRERVRQLLETGKLAGFRIEGRARARNVDLEGEGGENDQVLLSIQQAAERAGVSAWTIRSWITAGRLVSFRIEGDRRLYVRNGLEEAALMTKPVHVICRCLRLAVHSPLGVVRAKTDVGTVPPLLVFESSPPSR
jgi:excisionase family DNA binding protein